jgi:hypothetical protein
VNDIKALPSEIGHSGVVVIVRPPSLPILVLSALPLVACGARTALDDGSQGSPISRDAGTTPGEGGTSCASSGNVTLVSLPWAGEVALPLAQNDASVYWLYSGPGYADGGSVMTVPKCGGAAKTLASGLPLLLGAIAVDSQTVYWTNLSDQNQGSVMSLPIHGGAPVTLAAGGDPGGITLDATSIYWTDAFGGTVVKMPKGGGAPTTLATKQYSAGDIAINTTVACWTLNNGTFPDTPVSVVCISLDGGTPFTVAAGSAIYWGLTLDETAAYVAAGDGSGAGTILAAPLAGGTPITLGAGDPAGIAVDDTNVYWTTAPFDGGTGSLIRVPKQGGVAVTLAAGQNDPGSVAVDAQRVYWTDDPSVFVDAGPAVLAGPK